MSFKIKYAFVSALVILISVPAQADQIDGEWCNGLKHLSIDGPNIVTPGGTRVTGPYDRHAFKYVAPNGEPDAGATISMVQQHDELMHSTSSLKPEEIVRWTPCRQHTS